jgi:8-oxo-dGTP pyrophosphatase MutT (NUDIX family)
MNNNKTVLVAGVVLFRERDDKTEWFLSKESSDGEWELPKTIVRKGESSVRAVIRLMSQKGSMSTRVLEEAGRSGGVSTINGKTVPRRFIYYTMLTKSQATEAIGFIESKWYEYKDASKKLTSKKEQTILKEAYEYYKVWKKQGPSRYHEDDDLVLEDPEADPENILAEPES